MGRMRRLVVLALVGVLAGSAVTAATAGVFPSAGKVVPGQTIGGVSIGMTEQQVRQIWGANYVVCASCGPLLTWLYEYQGGEPLGAAVKFNVPPPAATPTKTAASKPKTGSKSATSSKTSTTSTTSTAPTNGTVVAVFTLGSPLGWGVKGQVMMFDPVSNVYNLFGNPGDSQCVGYAALTVRVGSNTMSFYTSSGVIYGFALTAPSQSPCQ